MPEEVALAKEVRALARQIARAVKKPVQFMEVCGTHAHAVGRLGLRQLLPEKLTLLSGPGCPVCVTPTGEIDWALELAATPEITVATFGDMIRVPGSRQSLADLRAQGANIQVVYSPMQALELAVEHSDRQWVFIGVGFETTAPTVAATIQTAARQGADNFSVLCCHKLIPPAMRALLAAGEVRIDGFLAPGHVSAILGLEPYQAVADEYHVPCVVAGFEAHDILRALLALARQVREKRAAVENEYARTVRPEGNPLARAVMEEVFEIVDARWRGLGVLPQSGYALREKYARFDAVRRYGLRPSNAGEHPLCHCGEVLRGVRRPLDCPAFADACTPEHPLGPCMVSSEGACAASYRYERIGK